MSSCSPPINSPMAPSYQSNRSSVATDVSAVTTPDSTPQQFKDGITFTDKLVTNGLDHNGEIGSLNGNANGIANGNLPSTPPLDIGYGRRGSTAQSASTSSTIKLVSGSNPGSPTLTDEDERKVRELRQKIAQESESLAKLVKLAEDLPKLKRLSQVGPSHTIHYSHDQNSVPSSTSNGSAGSSKVIINLQNTIDRLNRELKAKTESLNDEVRSKEALQKHCEIKDSSMEVIKHQNEMLNSLLDRKERKIADLEKRMSKASVSLKNYETIESKQIQERDELMARLREAEHKTEQLSVSYKAVTDSSKQLKQKQDCELKEIMAILQTALAQRKEDVKRIDHLETQLHEKVAISKRLPEIEAEAQKLAKNQSSAMESIFSQISSSLKNHEANIDYTMQLVQDDFELLRNHPQHKKNES